MQGGKYIFNAHNSVSFCIYCSWEYKFLESSLKITTKITKFMKVV